MRPINASSYELFHEGVIALAQVEKNGMRIDTEYLLKAISETKAKIGTIVDRMKADKIYKAWRKTYGQKFNLDSREQLATILFEQFEYVSTSKTDTGKDKVDEEALSTIDSAFVRRYLKLAKLKKAMGTYLLGIKKATDNGIVHPSFNLNFVVTFRSSSDSPNFQNIPIRDPEIGKLIRQCFIPRDGHHIVEADYSGVEVHAATWYHHDPVMYDYLHDKSKDMHRDMAQQCFKLNKIEMINDPEIAGDKKRIKNLRDCGKGGFVFPQFYGDWFVSNATSLWGSIEKMHLVKRDGTSLYTHLQRKGITELGVYNRDTPPQPHEFIHHMKAVENDFWNNRFKVYNQWKSEWWDAYCHKGYFETLTGFRTEGVFNRKEVTNYVVQGTAFHCLLWSLIRIQKILTKYKMKSLIVGQIHDSIVADVYAKELKDYLEIANTVMTQDICKKWKWITTQLEIEAEVAPINQSWYHKQEYSF